MIVAIVTWCRRTRIIHVGGTTRAAWAPIGQGSSICCSMKQDILLWYWKEKSITRPLMKYPFIRSLMSGETFPKTLTACLHQEQLMATISLLWKVNFCWKPCTEKNEETYLFCELIKELTKCQVSTLNAFNFKSDNINNIKVPSRIVYICLLAVSDAPSDDAR